MRRQAERRRVKKPSVISRSSLCWVDSLTQSYASSRRFWSNPLGSHAYDPPSCYAQNGAGGRSYAQTPLRRKFPANREKYRETCPPVTPPTCGFCKISSIYLKLA